MVAAEVNKAQFAHAGETVAETAVEMRAGNGVKAHEKDTDGSSVLLFIPVLNLGLDCRHGGEMRVKSKVAPAARIENFLVLDLQLVLQWNWVGEAGKTQKLLWSMSLPMQADGCASAISPVTVITASLGAATALNLGHRAIFSFLEFGPQLHSLRDANA